MIKATIDESGSHREASVLVVAACLSDMARWQLFENEWQPLADSVKGGRSKYHASRSTALNPDLAALIRSHMGLSVAIAMAESDYRTHVSQKSRARYGSSYTFAVAALITEIGAWARRSNRGKIAYLIETGHKNQIRTEQLCDYLTTDAPDTVPHHVESISWGNKKDLSLHPPDLVSHEISVSMANGGFAPTSILNSLRGRVVIMRFGPAELQKYEGIMGQIEWHFERGAGRDPNYRGRRTRK